MRMTTLQVVLVPSARRRAAIALGHAPGSEGFKAFQGPSFHAPDDYSIAEGVLYVKPYMSDGTEVEYIYPLHTISRVKVIKA